MNNKQLKITPQVLAQIENGVPYRSYLNEGQMIMQDVNQMIENLKDGNYNNFVGSIQGSPTNETSKPLDENQSVISQVNKSTIKQKRMMQIRRLEKEYAKLQKRFIQGTDPIYIADLKQQLK